MTANRVAGSLEGCTYALAGLLTSALAGGIDDMRARRIQAASNGHFIAASVANGSAEGHAESAISWMRRAVGAEAEVDRLRDLVAELKVERIEILRGAAEIILECDELRSRMR